MTLLEYNLCFETTDSLLLLRNDSTSSTIKRGFRQPIVFC